MSAEFATAGVVGIGTMGSGIAEVLARSGVSVIGVEKDADSAARAQAAIEASTARAVAGEKLTESERADLLGRITIGTDLTAVAEVDLVIEAVPEDLELKQQIFTELGQITRPEAVLATNTSSLSVTEISVSTANPRRVLGLHFFNPAPVQAFVEVVRTVVTDQSAVDAVKNLAEKLGKTPVVCGDKAGFIANALLFGYLNHAVQMYESRYATREDIDAAMMYGCGYPMGPLALLDLIGLDSAYEILNSMYKQDRKRVHAPAPILKQMITAGLLGRKTGKGFYTYAGQESHEVVADEQTPSKDRLPQLRHEISRVGVIGTGTMATGIVEVFAKAGYDVVFVARSEEKAAGVQKSIAKSLEKAVQRGKLTEEARDATLAKVTGTTKLDDLASVDLVVEAVVEDIDVKRALFENLDEICRPGAILATTTSSLPVIELAATTKRPGDVVGMHFFNPATIMKLVEVVHTVATSPEVTETTQALCAKLGKVAVTCGDRAGFIVNALLFPYLNDAVKMLEAHYATADDIDLAMKEGCRLPMGPFALLDVVGLDVSLAIERTLFSEFRESGFAPAPLLEHLVTAGYLGRKTGRGFRDYS
ncbi:3-hydroxyacyl-CoA dehydrogenase family protein [Sporichthya polymorpha]|uniref:3-hydroxyacyl-CoA dehydrogenase family protein n=1 Tax=Sporichthya polymorpha TaxID=35751 RepID=UPI000362A9BD|nr:3-hydroxybutyryl-CoA dehydrogenase [Sporichthya polymorpha]